jgi:MFS family permease
VRAIVGLLYGLGGMALGVLLGAGVGMLINHLVQTTSREGAAGYLLVAAAIIGGLLGLVAGLALYAGRAPTGQMLGRLGYGVLGTVALVALLAAAVWASLQLREAPLMYEGDRQANLLLEFRLKREDLPAQGRQPWLSVEVHTATTRPEATMLWDRQREEAGWVVVPAVQGALMRSGSRFIVAHVRRPAHEHYENFSPPMPRTPDPKADWSAWVAPREVFGPPGSDGNPTRAGAALLQMRWRIELYGQ